MPTPRSTVSWKVAETTCDGEGLNRSAYWVPAIYDANGERMKYEDVLFYYKSGYHIPADEIQAPPEGLRMIAGNAKSKRAQDVEVVKYRCEEWVAKGPQFDPGDPLTTFPTFPTARSTTPSRCGSCSRSVGMG